MTYFYLVPFVGSLAILILFYCMNGFIESKRVYREHFVFCGFYPEHKPRINILASVTLNSSSWLVTIVPALLGVLLCIEPVLSVPNYLSTAVYFPTPYLIIELVLLAFAFHFCRNLNAEERFLEFMSTFYSLAEKRHEFVSIEHMIKLLRIFKVFYVFAFSVLPMEVYMRVMAL